MPEDLDGALAAAAPPAARRGSAGPRRRGRQRRSAAPPWRRAELRPIDLKDGRRLQVVTYDERKATHPQPGVRRRRPRPRSTRCWPSRSATGTCRRPPRPCSCGSPRRARRSCTARPTPSAQHTEPRPRRKPHLIDPGDPLFTVLGAGASKRRQVDAFLRVLRQRWPRPSLPADRPLRVVDLGCGNAYLTFAAYRYLSERSTTSSSPASTCARRRASATPRSPPSSAGPTRALRGRRHHRRAGPGRRRVDVVLALHACDTATDDALAQAVRWEAPVVLASPCCHHDLQRQLTAGAGAGAVRPG